MDAIQRHAGALPRLIALHALRAQLGPLAELPAAPSEWHDALPALQTEATTLAVRREGLERDQKEASAALAAIVVDEAALAAAARLDALNDLLARHVTAEKDIPVRTLEVRQADLQIAGILGRLGRCRAGEPEPQLLVLPAATTGTLRKLIEQYLRNRNGTGDRGAPNQAKPGTVCRRPRPRCSRPHPTPPARAPAPPARAAMPPARRTRRWMRRIWRRLLRQWHASTAPTSLCGGGPRCARRRCSRTRWRSACYRCGRGSAMPSNLPPLPCRTKPTCGSGRRS